MRRPRLAGPSFMAFVAVGGAMLLGGGCVLPHSVPDWAKHVRPTVVDLDFGTERVVERLRWELAQPKLAESHLAPEQLAAVAVAEIEQGHDADAALWLALASYRYRQESFQAVDVAMAREVPQGVRMGMYKQWVMDEVRVFAGLDFTAALDLLAARAYGRGGADQALEEQLASLGKTTPMDREALRDTMLGMRSSSSIPPGSSRYGALVEAFRVRLKRDAVGRFADSAVPMYLARTPVVALQREAVQAVSPMFAPGICEGVANAFPLLRAETILQLGAPRPEVRSNAAATLALAPSNESRAALEARLAIEPDAGVKLTLAYALVRHDVPQHLPTVIKALEDCEGRACTLPTMLAQWLPADAESQVPEDVLADIVADADLELRARLFAAAILRDRGAQGPLSPQSIRALIAAGRNKEADDPLGRRATEALRFATSLSREEVVSQLVAAEAAGPRGVASFPGPLLARLAMVANDSDLALLGRMMKAFGDGRGPEPFFIVEAAERIRGEAADAKLVNWFNQYPKLQTAIAVGLARRGTVSKEQMDRLSAHGGAGVELPIKLVTHAADGTEALRRYLSSGTPAERLVAAELSALVPQADVKGPLLELLKFHDDGVYPRDALIRHAAMESLVRRALINTKQRPATPPTAALP